MASIDNTRSAARGTQKRGDARRELLLDALHSLLETHDFHEITFVAVCKRAGIPHGSARHFYPDLAALLGGLLVRLGEQHDLELTRPVPGSATRSARAFFGCLIERVARFHRRNPVCAKLTIGGRVPPDLKRLDRDADLERARFVLARLSELFVVPRHRDNERVMYCAVETIDVAFMLSMRESERLTPWWVRQAKRAAVAILEAHFGELKPRAAARGGTGPRARSRRRRAPAT